MRQREPGPAAQLAVKLFFVVAVLVLFFCLAWSLSPEPTDQGVDWLIEAAFGSLRW